MSNLPNNQTEWPNPRYGWYITIVLLIAFTFSYVDRQVLNLLVEPIREDLGLSDTKMSFLQGVAFVLTYVAMSVPIGRMVDKFNRVFIMITGVLVWSAATISCGLSRTYIQLMVARMGVGVGEAALTPAAWSILSDYFHPDKRLMPISVYLMGPYVGAGVAMIAGAQVLDWTREVDQVVLPLVGALAPWQFTFVAVGLPGIIITALLLTIKEPIRRGQPSDAIKAPPWKEVAAYIRKHKEIYLAIHVGIPFSIVMLYGLQAWIPTILVRVYEWDLAQAGRTYGLVALIMGSAGVLTGPLLCNFFKVRGYEDYPIRVAIIAAVGAAVSLILLAFQSNAYYGLVCVALASFFVPLPMGVMTTTMQFVTPNNMRGVVAGMYVVTTNVIGLGLGPTLVALCTDYVFADPTAVANSLGLVCAFIGPISVGFLLLGRKPYIERARELGDQSS